MVCQVAGTLSLFDHVSSNENLLERLVEERLDVDLVDMLEDFFLFLVLPLLTVFFGQADVGLRNFDPV